MHRRSAVAALAALALTAPSAQALQLDLSAYVPEKDARAAARVNFGTLAEALREPLTISKHCPKHGKRWHVCAVRMGQQRFRFMIRNKAQENWTAEVRRVKPPAEHPGGTD